MKKRKWLVWVASVLGILALIFLLGPKPDKPDFSTLEMPVLPHDLQVLEDSLNAAEASLALKPDNEARILWATPYQKTAYSMVYLHGNGASQQEGDPIHEALAHRYGCNLYLARLQDHGLIDDNPMLHIEATAWMQSALDAIAIGLAIGEKVVLVSCSTGSTFALYLAAKYPGLVDAQILLSPNIDYYDPRSFMMAKPWGMHITKQILNSDFYGWIAPAPAHKYWYTRYRVEGLITLKSIIDETMTEEIFNQINDPVYLTYYYKDDVHQDHVVSVKRMREMYAQLGTPPNLKKDVPLVEAGTHIIGSDLFNNQLDEVWIPLVAYCENILHLEPVQDSNWRSFIDLR